MPEVTFTECSDFGCTTYYSRFERIEYREGGDDVIVLGLKTEGNGALGPLTVVAEIYREATENQQARWEEVGRVSNTPAGGSYNENEIYADISTDDQIRITSSLEWASPVQEDSYEVTAPQEPFTYGNANLVIEGAGLADSPVFNTSPKFEVTVTNDRPSTDSESGLDAGYVFVSSPDYDQHILVNCFTIEPGQTVTIDDSTGNSPGLDGVVDIPASSDNLSFTVTVAGYDGESRSCAEFVGNPTAGSNVRTQTVGVTPQKERAGLQFALLNASVTPSTVQAGEEANFSVDVVNTAEYAAAARVVFTIDDRQVGETVTETLDPQEQTTASINFIGEPPETTICADVEHP